MAIVRMYTCELCKNRLNSESSNPGYGVAFTEGKVMLQRVEHSEMHFCGRCIRGIHDMAIRAGIVSSRPELRTT
jgi:hypothetical protein